MYPPLSGLFDSRPVTCVPTATIEGWKSDPGRIFRPCTDCFLVFSSPLFPSNSLGGNANFQILFPLSLFLFLRSMFRARNFRNSSIALDEDWFRTLCKLFLFFFVKSLRNLRKGSSNRSSFLTIFGYHKNIFRFSVEEICWKVFFLRNR